MLVCQKLCLNHLEIVTTDYTETCKRETPRDKSTIEGLQIEVKTKLMEVLGLYPDMCDLGPQEYAKLPEDGKILGYRF